MLDFYLISDEQSNTSSSVGQKNRGRPYLKQTARSLRYIIRGNEPDSWKPVWREWGTQKEKF